MGKEKDIMSNIEEKEKKIKKNISCIKENMYFDLKSKTRP